MTDCDLDTSVPDWVIDHPETMTVFRELGIDTCCGGKSLRYVCRQHGLDAEAVLAELLNRTADRRPSRPPAIPTKNPRKQRVP